MIENRDPWRELLRVREELGLSVADMARAIGVPTGTYINWEYRNAAPRPKYQKMIEEFLGDIEGKIRALAMKKKLREYLDSIMADLEESLDYIGDCYVSGDIEGMTEGIDEIFSRIKKIKR